jgi:hypothetical protein
VSERATPTPRPRSAFSSPGIRLGAVVALAVLVGLAVWLILDETDDSGSTTTPTPSAIVSAQGLSTLATALGHPIYWAGKQPGKQYELTQLPDGRVYVRYLPKGAKAGSDDAYLTIGTYPMQNALAVTADAAAGKRAVRLPIRGGGAAFYSKQRPQSIYFAFPNMNYQVEIYDPRAAVARRQFGSGKVAPVPTSSAALQSATGTLDRPALAALAGALGRPVYWAGPEAGKRYELTQPGNGRIFVRYLPETTKAGTKRPFLTVATYPLANAVGVTKAAAKRAGSVVVKAPRGGYAFYSKSEPTSVYVAFPGRAVQIEVYDPDAARARQLVSSGKIVTIR